MKYHRADPDLEWPLAERLWEARRGVWVGVVLSAVTYLPLLLLAFAAKSRLHWSNSLIGLLADWRFELLLTILTIYRTWAQEVDMVNQDSITSEERLYLRIRALEGRMEDLTKSLGK